MPPTTLTLAPWDAAIILKQDGTFEASLPQVCGEFIPENVILGAALAYALRNEDLCTLIRENFEQECTIKGEAQSQLSLVNDPSSASAPCKEKS
jgi:hypothetical protein